MYPGFWSCALVGTNHPVHPDTDCAVVLASFLKNQVLETSALRGLTTHLTGDDLHIRNPPPNGLPTAGAAVSKL
jgi:hypothetical protein